MGPIPSMHTPMWPQLQKSTTVVASAQARGVPIVTSRQMLDWLDHRNSSSFGGVTWSGNTLSFTVTPGTGSQNVPTDGLAGLAAGEILRRITCYSHPER